MKDIPIFTTNNGVASLIFNQIPYSGIAYIRMQSTLSPKELLEECVDCCIAAGAEAVYATGENWLDQFPFVTSVISMKCVDPIFSDTDACAVPVKDESIVDFSQIYNTAMAAIPNATCMSINELRKLLQNECCYYVILKDRIIGIGIASGSCLDTIVSLEKGKGSDVLAALYAVMEKGSISIEVASANTRAIRFFSKCGFVQDRIISKWYKVFSVKEKDLTDIKI